VPGQTHSTSSMSLDLVAEELIRTHVLIPNGVSLAESSFYDALRHGHTFFSLDLITDATGFTFMAENGKQVLGIMGDTVPLSSDLRLTVVAPAPAQMALFKDGRSIATTTTQIWHVPVTETGIYRIEASRHAQPWIFSNPIIVTPPESPKQHLEG